MSLILDALKKSEQSRPQMLESGWLSSGVARQPPRVPVWGWAVIALLLINVLILLAIAISPSAVDTTAVDSEPSKQTMSEPVSATTRRTSVDSRMPAGTVMAAATQDTGTSTSRQLEPLRADLPSRDMLLAQGTSIPSANITLHVFDSQRNSRFILLDGQRLGEGDSSRSGLRVNAITADGVVFSFGNNNFKVSIQ